MNKPEGRSGGRGEVEVMQTSLICNCIQLLANFNQQGGGLLVFCIPYLFDHSPRVLWRTGPRAYQSDFLWLSIPLSYVAKFDSRRFHLPQPSPFAANLYLLAPRSPSCRNPRSQRPTSLFHASLSSLCLFCQDVSG